jgi:murein DD-endopeptidase MepM/ murein hydrolase activator NlpD
MKKRAARELQKLQTLQSKLGLGKYARFYLAGMVLLLAVVLVFQDSLFKPVPRALLSDVGVAASELAISRRNIPTEKVDSFLRLTSTYDNYNRCQNKLGLRYDGSASDEQAVNNSLKVVHNQGGKFTLFSVDNPSQLQAAVDYVMAARKQNLRAIIELKGSRFGHNPQAMIAFLQAVSEKTLDSIFVATVTADYETYQAMKAAGQIASMGGALGEDATAVATALRGDDDIILASPVLEQFHMPTAQCLALGDEGVCYKLDSADKWRLYNQVHYVADYLDQDLFDVHLLSITNAELGFGNLAATDPEIRDKTNEALRASYAFEKYTQPALEDFNTKYDAFRRAIIVDLGPQADTNDMPRDLMQRRLLYDYGLLSDNPLVEGIVVGQSLRQWFADDNLSRLHVEGTNCNYDSVDYESQSTSEKAAAPVVGSRTVNSGGKAKVRVVCAGALSGGADGQCIAEARFTLKIGLPILHCGSNSIFGTDTRPFSPPAIRAAIQYNLGLDYLNQYAGRLSTDTASPTEDYSISNYPLPWLGTCLGSHYPDYSSTLPPQSQWDLKDSSSNKGVSRLNYGQESAVDHFKRKAFSSLLSDFTDTADERYFVWGRDLVINKDNLAAADTNTFNLLNYGGNDYQPLNVGGGKVASIVNDPQNYVYGSEMIIEDKQLFSKSSNTLAYEEYVYRLRNNGNKLFTSKDVFEIKNTSPAAGCGCALGGPATLFWTPYNIGRGCELTQAQISGGQCIAYKGGADSLDRYANSDFEIEVDLPEIPEYKIEGAYDTLAALYNRVQTKLSQMGRKLVVNSKRGWQADLSVKAYQLPAYFSPRVIQGARDNNMLEQVNIGSSGRPFNLALNNGPQSRIGGTVAGVGTGAPGSDANSCKSGVNFATKGISSADIDAAVGYGYGYGQILTTALGIQEDADMMSAICSKGMVPILRYCYDGGPCAFEQPVMDASTAYARGEKLAGYYRDVANAVGTSCNLPLYFVCGHNEPISEYVTHNGLEPNAGMQTEGRFSKGCVDALQADGEKIRATTSIFNATIGDAPADPVTGFIKYNRASTNVTNFITGYGGTAELAKDIDSSALSCVALNTYSFGTNPDQLAGHYFNEVMNSSLMPTNATACVMETGWVGTSTEDQNANAESVIESLLSVAGERLDFFLYYNATDTGGEQWHRFALTPENNEKIGQCQIDVTPVDDDDPTKPTFIDSYNMHLTEGDNYAREFQYYEYLENINFLHFVDTVYLSESQLADPLARSLVGLPLCEELSPAARQKVDCLAPYTTSLASSSYIKDPLGKFLCARGYNIVGETCQRQCTTTVTGPSGGPNPGQSLTEVESVEDFPVGFRNLADKIEADMCVPKGLLYALIERETPAGISLITGDPYQKLYERPNYAGASGPAQFTDIAWSTYNNPAYGKETGLGFLRDPYGTKYCLDKLGVDYGRSDLWESNNPFVLNRSVIAYGLCGAAAKLKADSGTGGKCSDWSVADVYKAASAYLGACEQNGRQYCSSYVATMCALFPAENAKMCGELGYEVTVQCTDDETPGQCSDGLIRLIHPLRANAKGALVSQAYGGDAEHSGIDYAIKTGTPVYAAASGRVIKLWTTATGNASGSTGDEAAGNFVKLEHTRTGTTPYYTSYQHLSTVDVELGDIVELGQKIGSVGNTGNSTGSHLHFELRLVDCSDGYKQGEKPFGQCSADPADYLITEAQMSKCEVNGDQNGPTNGICPVEFPGSASISQGSVITPVPPGAALGSHKDPFVSAQNPTDILTSGQNVLSPIAGKVEAVMNPRETFALYNDPGLCNNATTASGEVFYEGGFAIYVREDGTDNLWRFVHLEIPTVTEGQVVKPGDKLGVIFDGLFSASDVYDGVNWDEFDAQGVGCFRRNYQHLHFAIISANAAPKPAAGASPEEILNTYRANPRYAGNTIDSVPWVQGACGF